MLKVFLEEFRNDVVRVARNREPGVTIAQVANDFGIRPGTLEKWLYRDRVDHDELFQSHNRRERAELCKRNRLLKQEVEVPPCDRIPFPGSSGGKIVYPLVNELTEDGIPVQVPS